MEIKCFEGNYDKELFYSKMGRFFAEENYIRLMPYLKNERTKVWFTIEKNGRVIAFSSLLENDSRVLFTTAYVEMLHRRQGLFKKLTDIRFEYCKEIGKPIATATDKEFIKAYFEKRNFKVYRTTKNYWFLISNNITQ